MMKEPGTEGKGEKKKKDIRGKTGEIQIKSVVNSIVPMFISWFY